MRNRPLIVHVLYRFDVGGLENGVVNLINRMPADRFQHAIIALSGYSEFRKRLIHDVPVYALHKQEGKDLGVHGRLFKLLRKLKPDIVHTRNLNALEAQLTAWLAGVRGRVHGEHGWDVHDLDGSSRKYRFWRRMFRPFVQRYIPLSLHLAAYLERDVGVPASRISCICNGVDTARFRPDSEPPQDLPAGIFGTVGQPHDAAGAAFVIGTVGRMERVKDQMTLAQAFAALLRRRPDLRQRVRLVMVGDGSLRSAVREFLQEQRLDDISWLPGQRDDTAQLMGVMDLFVLPSLAEGISNTILEAMATGLPIVATDVGGNGELVKQGDNGCLVPRSDPEAMASAIAQYIDDPHLRERHGRCSRMRAEHQFSIEHMVAQYVEVYERLLSPSGTDVAVNAGHRR